MEIQKILTMKFNEETDDVGGRKKEMVDGDSSLVVQRSSTTLEFPWNFFLVGGIFFGGEK